MYIVENIRFINDNFKKIIDKKFLKILNFLIDPIIEFAARSLKD